MLKAASDYPRTTLALLFAAILIGITLQVGRATTPVVVLAPIAIFAVSVAPTYDRRSHDRSD